VLLFLWRAWQGARVDKICLLDYNFILQSELLTVKGVILGYYNNFIGNFADIIGGTKSNWEEEIEEN
jgi:hypothetical protein